MQKIIDAKTGKKATVFEKYELSAQQNSCPECNRIFKEYDIKRLDENIEISCSKCGAKLKRV